MKKYFILAAAVAMFTACTNNDDITQQSPTENERIPLLLSTTDAVSSPVVRTRSNENNIQSTTLVPTSTAVTGIFILKSTGKTNTSPELYEKWNIPSTGYATNGNVAANTNITTAALYYPDSKSQKLDIYAYLPRDASYSGTDISSTAATVTIKDDQSAKVNYLLSDVLWGCVGDQTNGGVETATGNKSTAVINATQYLASKTAATYGFVQTSGEIIIPMFHKAAKIIVKITPSGMDVSKLKGATVNFYVNGTQGANPGVDPNVPTLSTLLNVYTGAITALTPATPTHYIAPIKFTDKLGKDESSVDIAASASDVNGTSGAIGDGSTISGYACSGIILPQTVTAGDKLIEIVLSDGTKYAYTIPTTGTPTPVTNFQSGKVYTYTITITASGLQLTTTIANWDSQSGDTGDAVLQ